MFYAFNSIQTQPALNDFLALKNKAAQIFFAVLSVLCIVSSGRLIEHYGILPSRENAWFQIAAVLHGNRLEWNDLTVRQEDAACGNHLDDLGRQQRGEL